MDFLKYNGLNLDKKRFLGIMGRVKSFWIYMYYVYVIESQKNKDLYKGFTIDLNNRIKEHNNGSVVSTKNYRPWKLVYCEVFLDKQDAIKREKYLKGSWGRKFLKEVIKNYLKVRK